MPGEIVDDGSGSYADPSHLSRERVGDVVAVQVHGSNDAVLFRPGENLLQERIGDDVLDDDASREPGPWPAVQIGGPVLLPSHGVPPIAEAALSELHDVALVNQRHAFVLLSKSVVDGGTDEALRALLGD